MKEDEELSFLYCIRRFYLIECYYFDFFFIEIFECENFIEVKCGN